MINQMLTTLSRGRGKNGRAYDDYKTNYPESIPYYLRDVAKRPSDFPPLPKEKKHRLLPGTYLTNKGQMMLYTRAKKNKNLGKETADTCKNLQEVYDIVQTVNEEFRVDDINVAISNSGIGDLPMALGNLKNNWFYPQKWNSPAKVLVPEEALDAGYDFKDYLSNKNYVTKIPPLTKKPSLIFKKVLSASLTDVQSNIEEEIPLQTQNNANESLSNSMTDQLLSSIDPIDRSVDGTQTALSSFSGSVVSSSHESFCEVDEDIIIRKNAIQKGFHFLEDKESFCGDPTKIEIADVLGGDSILSDIKTMDVNAIPIRHTKSNKSDNQVELRVQILKDLYEKLNFLSSAKRQLKLYSENLLHQFQEFNMQNRKIRVTNKRKEIHQTIQEMKERNDEIRLRLQRLSEKKILDKKDTMDRSTFNNEWDNMLLDLSRKSKLDMETYEKRRNKLLQEEELKMKEFENDQIKVEHSSIVYAFATLKNELVKIDDEKTDIEHYIIRLEMGRENIGKIEREIMNESPQPFALSKCNFQSYFEKIKEQTIINWKLKMADLANNFKVDESKLMDMITSDCELNSINKEKNTKNNPKDVNLNAFSTDVNECGESQKLSTTADIEDITTESNKLQLPPINQKNYMMKLDYEMMKVDQKISANHTYSYFIPWPRENYERSMGNHEIISEDEEETVKPKKYYKLDYKRILAHNPLKDKRRKKYRK